MKFQCVLCLSTYNTSNVQLGESINCSNCNKNIVVPKKAFDRGRVIGGDFVIDRVLGTGGMGTVYLAKQISLEREVALKVLSRKFSVDPKFRMEFQREARAASRLTHTNLVQAYAFGEDEGDLFLAMEYVEGLTLGDRLDNDTRLMVDEALNIIQQVAEGLHFAWTQEQLIHRDIKPDNIMLTTDGHVKLTDMGLARTAVELENVTEVSGTPAYMNPEQFTKQAMDCRADIYSLGVCLFHSITGQLPFDSPNVRELARQHIQDKVEFPDKVVDLPNEVKKLLRKMMSKNREERQDDHDKLLHEIFNTRQKINNSGAHIPSVHTLSFNRYEFKNMTPQRKGSAKDTQVNSTKQLPRRKIKPLSSGTSSLTTSYSASDEPKSLATIFMSNLFAACAVIGAIVIGFMFGGDSESAFYIKTQTFIESIDQSKVDIEKVLEKTDELLSMDTEGTLNKKDYYARNRLLEINNRYLKQVQEKKDLEIREINKKLEVLKEGDRETEAARAKNASLIQDKIKYLEELLTEARNKQHLESDNETVTAIVKNQTFSYSKAISDDMQLLQKLWEKEKHLHRLEILKLLATRKFQTAQKYVDDSSREYSGAYNNWFLRQNRFISEAEKVWNTVELNLSELKDTTIEINGRVVTIERVYPQTAELETAAGTLIKLTDENSETFIDIYKLICESLKIKPVNGAAYAVSALDFNFAVELRATDIRVIEYAKTYIEERLNYLARLIESSDKIKAEDVALKLYNKCSKVSTFNDLALRITKIIGRDIFSTDSN